MERILIHKSDNSTHRASVDEIRAVWAMISEKPSITVREMARRTNMKITYTHYIVAFLERAGYIKRVKHKCGRRVVIPFYELDRKP